MMVEMKRADKKSKTSPNTLRRDYLEVVAEEIRDQVKTIGEGHKILNEKLDRNLEEIRKEFETVHSSFQTVFDYLSRIDDELKEIKNEMKKFKEELKSKTDLVRFEELESRVLKIEAELARLA